MLEAITYHINNEFVQVVQGVFFSLTMWAEATVLTLS